MEKGIGSRDQKLENMVMITLYARQQKRHMYRTDVQNSLSDSVEEGEGGMIWENGIETCIILGKK